MENKTKFEFSETLIEDLKKQADEFIKDGKSVAVHCGTIEI